VNSFHLEYCASPEWREILQETILPEALKGKDLGERVIEIGPGPGLTTDVLCKLTKELTAVEMDPQLASSLRERTVSSNVKVLEGDATSLDLPDDSFSGAASFHMMHHIEEPTDQDKAFRELARVLRPGGLLVAADSVWSEESALIHQDDIYNPIDPAGLTERLIAAGFRSVEVRTYSRGWVASAVAA